MKHTNEKFDSDKDAATNISRDVSRRDMATQISPEGSLYSSPRRLSFSPLTPPVLPIVELESPKTSKLEVRDIQADEQYSICDVKIHVEISLNYALCSYDDEKTTEKILQKLNLENYQIGVLDSRRAEVLDAAAKCIQGRLRTFVAHRDFVSTRVAAVSLQACCRENRRRRVLVQDSGDWGLSGGKSNWLSRFVIDEFDLHSKAIVGIEFQTQVMEHDGKEIEAQVWNTTITSAYYRGTIGALVIYDITRRTTFDSIKRWLNELKSRDWML
ncbi:Ras-related protein RABA5d [Camellia lanceoleosa]|uniref:Ras-related protein RABA5d n=1 Tax=Camellia lanceoleosa TaxID=1840588 RepID=A0ACC0GD57_9ERIC|nr:Ras-related protein RABA5d [Camellia lanceoleosa]